MSIKVGESYKAVNGELVTITDEQGGGWFIGSSGEHTRIVYRSDGTTLTAGWNEYSIADCGGIDFQIGKRYHTRDGRIVCIKSTAPLHGTFTNDQTGALYGWDACGRWSTAPSFMDLMPGAIEEEAPACPTDDRLDKLEAMCTDLFRQLRGVRETMRSMADAQAGFLKTQAALSNRLDGLSARIAKLAEEDAAADQEISQRVDAYAAATGNFVKNIRRLAGDVATLIEAMNKRFEKIERFFPNNEASVDLGSGEVLPDFTKGQGL